MIAVAVRWSFFTALSETVCTKVVLRGEVGWLLSGEVRGTCRSLAIADRIWTADEFPGPSGRAIALRGRSGWEQSSIQAHWRCNTGSSVTAFNRYPAEHSVERAERDAPLAIVAEPPASINNIPKMELCLRIISWSVRPF